MCRDKNILLYQAGNMLIPLVQRHIFTGTIAFAATLKWQVRKLQFLTCVFYFSVLTGCHLDWSKIRKPMLERGGFVTTYVLFKYCCFSFVDIISVALNRSNFDNSEPKTASCVVEITWRFIQVVLLLLMNHLKHIQQAWPSVAWSSLGMLFLSFAE